MKYKSILFASLLSSLFCSIKSMQDSINSQIEETSRSFNNLINGNDNTLNSCIQLVTQLTDIEKNINTKNKFDPRLGNIKTQQAMLLKHISQLKNMQNSIIQMHKPSKAIKLIYEKMHNDSKSHTSNFPHEPYFTHIPFYKNKNKQTNLNSNPDNPDKNNSGYIADTESDTKASSSKK